MSEFDWRQNVDFRVSLRNGFNLTIDIDGPEAWHYLAVGVNASRLEVLHGSATEEEVSESMAAMAQGEGELPARMYAAGHRDYIEELLRVSFDE